MQPAACVKKRLIWIEVSFVYGCKPASVGFLSLEGQKFDGVTLSVSCVGLPDRQMCEVDPSQYSWEL